VRRPKGLFLRGKVWTSRVCVRGREHWCAWGENFSEAVLEHRRFRASLKARPVRRHKGDIRRMDALADRWLETVAPQTRNHHNVETARAQINGYIKPYFGHLRAEAVRPDVLRAFRAFLEQQPGRKKRKLSPSTVRQVLGVTCGILRWAAESGFTPAPIVPRRLMPKIPERPPDRLTEEVPRHTKSSRITC